MKKNVSITIVNLQTDETGEKNLTELKTTGSFFLKNDSIYLLYDEVDPESESITGNTLKLTGSSVELIRNGAIKTRMLFVSGTKTDTLYITPFGTMRFRIHTEEVTALFRDAAGEIRLKYDLYQEDYLLFHCNMSIRTKEETN